MREEAALVAVTRLYERRMREIILEQDMKLKNRSGFGSRP